MDSVPMVQIKYCNSIFDIRHNTSNNGSGFINDWCTYNNGISNDNGCFVILLMTITTMTSVPAALVLPVSIASGAEHLVEQYPGRLMPWSVGVKNVVSITSDKGIKIISSRIFSGSLVEWDSKFVALLVLIHTYRLLLRENRWVIRPQETGACRAVGTHCKRGPAYRRLHPDQHIGRIRSFWFPKRNKRINRSTICPTLFQGKLPTTLWLLVFKPFRASDKSVGRVKTLKMTRKNGLLYIWIYEWNRRQLQPDWTTTW